MRKTPSCASDRRTVRPRAGAAGQRGTSVRPFQRSRCLWSRQEAVGALVLESGRQAGLFLPEDLGFLQEVASLFALAISSFRPRLQAAFALDEANRLKAELISTLAHEMRTPLTSIKGYSTALLLEEASFSPETQREFLQIIDQECDMLQELIHDLLESSAIDAGLLKFEPQPVRMLRLVQALLGDMARRTQNHRIRGRFSGRFPDRGCRSAAHRAGPPQPVGQCVQVLAGGRDDRGPR